jgi:hypothetical protein
MTRLWILATVALTALCVASGALAKGATKATINGPGLDTAIVLKSDTGGDPTFGSRLGMLANYTGFFPAVFGQQPDPMTRERPDGKLGPKYTIDFVMPGPYGGSSTIRQDLYPYSTPYPLSYTKPGQRFWDTHRTHGGWFGAPQQMRTLLVSAGLPKTPPSSTGGGGDGDWLRWVAITITVGAGLGLVAVLALVGLRRRPGPATA